MMNNQNQTANQTIPTTIGALLAEEFTIDPLSSLPSFLELTFVDVARDSGRRALAMGWDAGVAWLEAGPLLARPRRSEPRAQHRAAAARPIADGPPTPPPSWSSLVLRPIALRLRRARAHGRLLVAVGLRRACRLCRTLGPELQALIMFAIDYHCVHHLAGATACEMAYGLRRSKVVRDRRDRRQHRVAELTRFDKTCSALLAALLPYWKDRCDRHYGEQTRGGLTHRPANDDSAQRSTIEETKDKFLLLYPYVHMLHEGSIFLYQFAYLVGWTHYWSASLHALGIILRRMTVADVQQRQKQLQKQQLRSQPQGREPLAPTSAPPLTKASPSPTPLSLPQVLRGAVLFSVSYTLLSRWYSHFQRALQWRLRRWIAGDEDASPPRDGGLRERARLPIPPPPMPPCVLNGADARLDKHSCPICREPRINPTAATSGYVFCYKCLISHLRRQGEFCPVTGMPCPEDRVFRLYEPTAVRRGVASGEEAKGR